MPCADNEADTNSKQQSGKWCFLVFPPPVFEDQLQARTTNNTANSSSANNTTAPANTTAAPQDDCGFSQDELEADLGGTGPFNFSCAQILNFEEEGLLVGKQ